MSLSRRISAVENGQVIRYGIGFEEGGGEEAGADADEERDGEVVDLVDRGEFLDPDTDCDRCAQPDQPAFVIPSPRKHPRQEEGEHRRAEHSDKAEERLQDRVDGGDVEGDRRRDDAQEDRQPSGEGDGVWGLQFGVCRSAARRSSGLSRLRLGWGLEFGGGGLVAELLDSCWSRRVCMTHLAC